MSSSSLTGHARSTSLPQCSPHAKGSLSLNQYLEKPTDTTVLPWVSQIQTEGYSPPDGMFGPYDSRTFCPFVFTVHI